MIIIALTDIHGKIQYLRHIASQIQAADLILISGDITHFGDREDIARIISEIRSLNNQLLVVPGNCDTQDVSGYLDELDINIHGRIKRTASACVLGIGGSLPCPGRTPNEYSEQDYSGMLNNIHIEADTCSPIIMVSHQPPAKTKLDRVFKIKHVGSSVIRNFILQHAPVICFTGHIHESTGTDHLGKTTIVNPGPFFKGKYAYAEIKEGNVEIDIKSIS